MEHTVPQALGVADTEDEVHSDSVPLTVALEDTLAVVDWERDKV